MSSESLSGTEENAAFRPRVRWARTAVSAKQENTGKKIGPVGLLFSTHPTPRMALVRGCLASGYHGVFSFLDNSLP